MFFTKWNYSGILSKEMTCEVNCVSSWPVANKKIKLNIIHITFSKSVTVAASTGNPNNVKLASEKYSL